MKWKANVEALDAAVLFENVRGSLEARLRLEFASLRLLRGCIRIRRRFTATLQGRRRGGGGGGGGGGAAICPCPRS